MSHYPYIIVGGGLTADAAVRGIRRFDANSTIALFSSESVLPYNRPPLSKALWKGEPEDVLWRKTPTDNVDLKLKSTVVSLNSTRKHVTTDSGETYGFDRLLLATGGTVRKLPYNAPGIVYFRDLNDYRLMRQITEKPRKIAVIGGGFIGAEMAAAFAMNKHDVTMLFPDSGIGVKIYPAALSQFLNTFYESKGVRVLAGEKVTGVEFHDSTYTVTTESGKSVTADAVVAGIGIQPDVALAKDGNLTVSNGIAVDKYLRTINPDIFAAGDVAEFPDAVLGIRRRVEHEDHASHSGEIAGMNMAGANRPYDHLPFFYSDLFELGYEAVGLLDSRMQIVEQWKEPFKEGVVYYLDHNRVRGVLLWNTWGQLDPARALIADPGPYSESKVKGRLPA
ncbi:MAG TPA: FAD/NAD(P)-binding oxidoreductase [Candidatus Acidoferrum sp.]|nr:FAD/NAD(P)-binding oxidoreductase [Candidatus Acidoferrum sp.]